MAETPHIMIEHLKAIRAELSAIRQTQGEHTERLGRIELGVARLRNDVTHGDEGYAVAQVRMDGIMKRIEHIERRLELDDSGNR